MELLSFHDHVGNVLKFGDHLVSRVNGESKGIIVRFIVHDEHKMVVTLLQSGKMSKILDIDDYLLDNENMPSQLRDFVKYTVSKVSSGIVPAIYDTSKASYIQGPNMTKVIHAEHAFGGSPWYTMGSDKERITQSKLESMESMVPYEVKPTMPPHIYGSGLYTGQNHILLGNTYMIPTLNSVGVVQGFSYDIPTTTFGAICRTMVGDTLEHRDIELSQLQSISVEDSPELPKALFDLQLNILASDPKALLPTNIYPSSLFKIDVGDIGWVWNPTKIICQYDGQSYLCNGSGDLDSVNLTHMHRRYTPLDAEEIIIPWDVD